MQESTRQELLRNEGRMYPDLSIKAREIVDSYNRRIKSGEYQTENVDCLCGISNFTTTTGTTSDSITNKLPLTKIDRYGMWHPTVFCDHCGLIYASPRVEESVVLSMYQSGEYRHLYDDIIPPSNTKKKEKEKDETQALYYAQRLIDTAKPLTTIVCEVLKSYNYNSKKKVLDFGCGGGWNLEYFRANGMEVYGCDLDPEILKVGKAKGLDLELGSFELIKDRSFDIIILNHVVEHFFHFYYDMFKLIDTLSDGGFIYISAPTVLRYSASNLFQAAHNYYFRISQLRYFMSLLGFKAVSYGHLSGFQDLYGVFRSSGEMSISSLHIEKDNFKNFLRTTVGLTL